MTSQSLSCGGSSVTEAVSLGKGVNIWGKCRKKYLECD